MERHPGDLKIQSAWIIRFPYPLLYVLCVPTASLYQISPQVIFRSLDKTVAASHNNYDSSSKNKE